MSDQYPVGTYVKGERVRICRSPRAAVAAVYEGYTLASTATKTDAESIVAPVTEDANLDGPDYKALQELAKEAGIPANQSKADLEAALEAHAANPTPTPES